MYIVHYSPLTAIFMIIIYIWIAKFIFRIFGKIIGLLFDVFLLMFVLSLIGGLVVL